MDLPDFVYSIYDSEDRIDISIHIYVIFVYYRKMNYYLL